MLLSGSVQSKLAIHEIAVPFPFDGAVAPQGRPATAPARYDPLPLAGRLEVSPLQVGQLTWAAQRALAAATATGPVGRRVFAFEDRAVILLAARATQGRRTPRDPWLVSLTLEFGTGLQLRRIGGLAIVAIELPFMREGAP